MIFYFLYSVYIKKIILKINKQIKFIYIEYKDITKLKQTKSMKVMKFINTWYPVILAFICMLYSIGLGLSGQTAEAQYSAHWPGTILLFALAIHQLRKQ